MEDQNQDQGQDQDQTTSATDQGQEQTGDQDQTQDDQPFLAVNDRTVYKTPDEAKRGYQNLQERLTSYSRFGNPEEIAGRLGRLEAFERMAGGGEGEKPKGPKSAWTPEQVEANRRWLQEAKNAGLLAEMGLLTKDEYDSMTAQQQEETRIELVKAANDLGAKWIQEHNLDVTEAEVMEALEFGGAMVNSSKRMNDLFFGGKVEQAVDECLKRYFAAQLHAQESAGAGAGVQTGNGARAAAAARQETGAKIKKLTSPPPKTGTAAGTKPPTLNLADPKQRRQYMEQLMEERGILPNAG